MRRAHLALLCLGSVLVLLLLLFLDRGVLFQGRQFAFRDSAHYYYPLELRVQQEWQAGRWPLWDPGQNGGQPLLGSPMAAVLYPGKLLYALVPYAWGVRLSIVLHTLLAAVGMLALARSLGISPVGAGLAALSYGFGAPVLTLYGNVIFLVGAAWLPLGLRAVDGLVRRGRATASLELALILTMQVLGGDPQAAYVTVLSGVGYAAWLAWPAATQPGPAGFMTSTQAGSWRARPAAFLAIAGMTWILLTAGMAWGRMKTGGWFGPIWIQAVLAWGTAGVWLGLWFRRHPLEPVPSTLRRLKALAGATSLALALAAVQIIPTAEFTASSNRTGEISTLTYAKFSTEPYRLVECLWPSVFGLHLPENRTWIQVLPPSNDRQLWHPSLYMGSLTLLLGLGAACRRNGGSSADDPPWRGWLTALVVISVVAGFGRFGSPLWWVRWIPGSTSFLGPHDPLFSQPRTDGFLEDGTGSVYALLAAACPGFGFFRYPSKLLTLSAAALAVLAGAGWDDAMRQADRSRRLARHCKAALVTGAVFLSLALVLGNRIVKALVGRIPSDMLSGPPDPAGAWAETQRALTHGVVVAAIGLALARWGPRRPLVAGVVVLLAMALDLGTANARLVWTAPQTTFDAQPEVAARIANAQATAPEIEIEPQTHVAPYRFHRMPLWHPQRFLDRRSTERISELTAWERGTLQGLNGLPWNLEETLSVGYLEQEDHLLGFRPRLLPASPAAAQALGVPPGQPILYYPRRGFDLWGTRYFLLPIRPEKWNTDSRGYASFVPGTDLLAPKLDPSERPEARDRWIIDQDWQLLRNKAAYPRAWIVHQARIVPPATDPEARDRLWDEILYDNDPFWSVPGRRVHDPRTMAWIETDDRQSLRGALSPSPNPSLAEVSSTESVIVTRNEPLRVELKAKLDRPGLVILAATHAPGWSLTIDGRPATILRANRTMRGAAVSVGEHSLVYTYAPWTFRAGLTITLIALATLLGLFIRLTWQAHTPRSASSEVP